ncbi:hypothetical protein BDR07DRAFT_1380912 [Suillus spraguei]|nr:hypothetical protein BDR07DRAFT_1380912 [Suillus spraguei]
MLVGQEGTTRVRGTRYLNYDRDKELSRDKGHMTSPNWYQRRVVIIGAGECIHAMGGMPLSSSSLSTDLHPYWNKSHGLQPEIQAYWIKLSKKYDLYPHIAFNTKSSKIPYEIPGVRKFQGTWFHSARWPSSIDLQNKRVAVIGNSSSGDTYDKAQFVPYISEDASVKVVHFIRTPDLVHDQPHIPYSDTAKWMFANVPLVMRLHRAWYMLQRVVPHHLPMGDNALQRRRSHQVASGLIVENGIITKTGEMLPFDVIVYATGFTGKQERYSIHVRGLNGATVQGYYDAHGGPTAYIGTAIPDIPNFYSILGPNTGAGVLSISVAEIQLIEPALAGPVSSLTVKAAPTDTYNAKLQERMSRSMTGKLFHPFPWPVTVLWWWLRKPNWDHYTAVGAEKWVWARRRKAIKNILKCTAVLTLLRSYVSGSAQRILYASTTATCSYLTRSLEFKYNKAVRLTSSVLYDYNGRI